MSDKKILVAFVLNLCFSIFELIGGIITNSVSIMSDAIHDFFDSISIGISYFLEKVSTRDVDNKYSYGYLRYSVLGALITNILLVSGSILVFISGIKRFINPVDINYDGMIIFAVIGVIVNFLAVFFTKDGHSLNQKAVSLHMLEDSLGWVVVLVGGILIKFTKINRIDAFLSICLSIFIFSHAIKGINKIVNLFLEKTPDNIDIDKIKEELLKLKDVDDVHHIHVRSIDGVSNYATLHVVSKSSDLNKIKLDVKDKLKEFGINHVTVELENIKEKCNEEVCVIEHTETRHHHH